MTNHAHRERTIVDMVNSGDIPSFESFGAESMATEPALTKRQARMVDALNRQRALGAKAGGKCVALLVAYYCEDTDKLGAIEGGTLVVRQQYRGRDLALVMVAVLIVWAYLQNRPIIAIVDDNNTAMLHLLRHFEARALEPDLIGAGPSSSPRELEFVADFPRTAIKAARILTDPHTHARFDLHHPLWRNAKLRRWLIDLACERLPEDDLELER